MNQYLSFTAEDFAQDADFLKWVKYPDRYPLLARRWSQWLVDNPHKKEEVKEARLMVLAIAGEKQLLPDYGKQGEVWARINETINESKTGSEIIPLWLRWYSKAAAIIITIGAGWFIWNWQTDSSRLAVTNELHDVMLEKQVNNSNLPRTIVLSDGTSIVLQPQSDLEYPKTFDAEMREVYLTGEAFFEVQRDTKRPFLVHTNEIVTRVLGTSFTVRSYQDEDNVRVQVKTGKVSVFKDKEGDAQAADGSVEGVVLMPNQQVIYERNVQKMTKSLVENPAVLIPIAKQEFEFVDTPVKEVFSIIEEAYGVEFVYDEEAFSDCFLNASLDDVPLYDKLKLICKGINATYEIMDSRIIIYGKGCSN